MIVERARSGMPVCDPTGPATHSRAATWMRPVASSASLVALLFPSLDASIKSAYTAPLRLRLSELGKSEGGVGGGVE